GKNAISWHQWLDIEKTKPIIEISPAGRIEPFPGHLEFILPYDDLVRVIANPQANRDWHIALKSVAGVYLIVDKTDGRQYVGSAVGAHGILGRWTEYARTGHGGNKHLKARLAEKGPAHRASLQFSVLTTLPRGMSQM